MRFAFFALTTASLAAAGKPSCSPSASGTLFLVDARDPDGHHRLGLSPVADENRRPFLQDNQDPAAQVFTVEHCKGFSRLSATFNSTTGCLEVGNGGGVVTLQACDKNEGTQGWSINAATQEVRFIGTGAKYNVAFPFLGGNEVVSEITTTPNANYTIYFAAD
ncbi:hypothetical protein AURDEDRAFT_173847 [Auricularia subglabra TFB-10046 SS5]|uniref:Ricin B lectin domain-containing protein n=1 Tax=Auricularia subglabra (strain TFB-10046 / SS5) TaxID=717982 RepID=J0CZL2_AURST|nr:hypothetical protein AURDEDRAFT_173847 [Auricularia subglabra TFB-10046 SS5]